MPFPFDPAPATLWTRTRDGKVASCEVRFVPSGVEAKIMRDGKLLYSRTFPKADDAMEWAEDERVEMLAKGWTIRIARADGSYASTSRRFTWVERRSSPFRF